MNRGLVSLALVSTLVTLTALSFTYNGTDYPYAQSAKSMATGKVTGLKLFVAGHTYDHGLNIGGILVDLIDNVALPQLTGVDHLGALFNQLVNCGGLASRIWSYIANICIGSNCIYQYVSANDFTKLCVNALDAAGNLIEDRLASLDAPGMMSVSDLNALLLEQRGHTGHADTIMGGAWSLTLPIGIGNVTLPGALSGTSAQ